MLELVARCEFW